MKFNQQRPGLLSSVRVALAQSGKVLRPNRRSP